MITQNTKCTLVIWNLNADWLVFSRFNRLLFWHIFPLPCDMKKNTPNQESQSHEKTVFQCKLFKLMLLNSGSLSNCWSRYIMSDKVTQTALLSLEDQRDGLNHAVCSVPRIWCLLSLGPNKSYPSSLSWCRITLSSEQVHWFLQR